MKTTIWKLRCAFALRRLLRTPWLLCWKMAGANLENLNGDTSECPVAAAEDERDAWAASA
jgi:hypothetical protein